MIRNRIPRFRNLQNLHVIPTASNILVNAKLTESESPPRIVSPSISNNNSEINMFNQNTQKSKFNKAKRRKRAKSFAAKQTQIENSSYHWYSPNYLSPAVCPPPPDKIEEVECTSEVPVEEDFEEVEVASVDADGKQEILVGFRPTKIHYLNYKKNCFFKPKIYKFDSQRTYVNCLNVQDNYSVDGDIVSEAEYEIEYETENLDQSEVQLNKIVEINVKSVTDHQNNASKDERNQAQEISIEDETSQRIYKTSIEDNADICQGQSLIQSNLDTWKSHLIGLEYLIEIQNKSKDMSAKYYCVLCSEDLHAEKVPAVVVINHINGCKHTVKYLEKHFPSCGFKFSENSGYNVVLLQKLCEEINKKLGFAFMCITNLNFYEKNEDKIKEIVQNASHPCEKNLKLDINTFRNAVESDLLKDVQDVVNSIFEKITMLEKTTVISECKSIPRKLEKEISSQASSQPEADPVKVATKTSLRNESIAKNKLKSPKSFLKYKGNSALSSYLKLKYTRTKFKGSKSFKGTTTKNVCDREKKLSATSNLEATKSEKAVCDLNKSDSSKKVLDSKEKEMQKPTIHSKYCRKRILGRENSRLRVAAKASTKDEFISGVLNKSNVKYVSVSESGNRGASKKIATDKNLTYSETMVMSSHKSSPLRKVTSVPIQKISRLDSKSPFTRYSKSPQRRISLKKGIESSKCELNAMMMSSSSNWKAMIRTSRNPVKNPPENSSYVLRSITRKHSRSPLRRSPVKRNVRRISKTPVRKVRSPIRQVIRSPARKFSRSPVRRHSRSPFRRNSRSPYRKLSKSPLRRKSRSPYWKHSRSPFRKKSRSPLRRHSRSQLRRQSRSPLRRRSRSPVRRRSRSPVRRHSRSPVRRHSRSPIRRHSRSPMRRNSRSPFKWHSRSPIRQHSRSPVKRLRSPIRKHSKSSFQNLSKTPTKEYRSIYKVHSPNIGHSSNIQDHIVSKDRFSSNVYNYNEQLGRCDRDYTKVRSTSKTLHTSISNTSDKHKAHVFTSSSARGISDLDPVSDEDESVYFDKQQHVEDLMTSSSSKMMLTQLFKKFSIPNVNPEDPSLNKLMQFMEAHSAEIQDLMGSRTDSKPGKINTSKVDSSVQERSLYLQQYLLSNLAESSQEPGLPSPAVNMQPKYQHPPFLSENVHAGYGLASNITSHNLSQSNVPRFFPPNISVPPPEPYHQFNQPHQEFSKSQVPPEVMFKDLKATVNKLFGANEGAAKQGKNKSIVPVYVTEPDPEKWDLNHPDTPKFNAPTGPKFSVHKFNAPIGQKSVFHSQGKNINLSGTPESSRAEMSVMYNNNNTSGQFFSGRGIDRPQVQNVPIPPPDAKVSFCDVPRGSSKGNLFPVVHNVQVNSNFSVPSSHVSVSDVKVSLAQRLASVLVKVGMTDVPAPLLQEMLMKIGAFSSLPRQDISEAEIISILKRLGYLS